MSYLGHSVHRVSLLITKKSAQSHVCVLLSLSLSKKKEGEGLSHVNGLSGCEQEDLVDRLIGLARAGTLIHDCV